MSNTNFSSVGQLCHICNSLQQTFLSDFKRCGRKQCRKVYCSKCIEENFMHQIYSDEGVDFINDWLCFSCHGMCHCKQCQVYHDESPQIIQTKPYSSKSAHGNHQNKSSDYLSQFREQSHSPFQYSQQLPYYHHQQKKFRGNGKSKKQRSLMGLKCEVTKKIPPYLVSIMKRKQIFKQFMLKHSKKTYQQLVKQSLNQKQQSQEKDKKYQENEKSNFTSPVTKPLNINNNQNSTNDFILYSPSQVPLTPSFLPLSQPLSSNGLKLSQMLNQKLKQYEVEQDDLSLQLL